MCWCVLVLFTRLSEGRFIPKFQWAQRDLTDATAALQQEVTERAKEQRRQHAADEERKRADEELAKIQADADAAERARGGLQQQLAAVQRQLAGSETGRLSALAAASRAKAETGILLAQLLGEADDLAEKFAKEADERYVAGSTCERTGQSDRAELKPDNKEN